MARFARQRNARISFKTVPVRRNQPEYVQSPLNEAQALVKLLSRGASVSEIRELIQAPADIHQKYPGDQTESALRFRERVAAEFEQLIRDGVAT